MTRIILVRHGQTIWNQVDRFRGHADVPMDETGLAQALVTSVCIAAQWQPGVVYAGPLSCTIKTAEAIAQPFKLLVQMEEDLIDVDCGKWQGLTPDEVRQGWPVEFENYLHAPAAFRFPGGEGLEDARLRLTKCEEDLSGRHPNQTIVLVSHTASNRLIILSALGLDTRGFWKMRQEPCAINVLEGDPGHFALVTMNETGHLLSVSPGRNQNESKTL